MYKIRVLKVYSFLLDSKNLLIASSLDLYNTVDSLSLSHLRLF
jgi:hypothetical protein